MPRQSLRRKGVPTACLRDSSEKHAYVPSLPGIKTTVGMCRMSTRNKRLGWLPADRGASVHYSIRCEAAELALDHAGEGDRCAVFEKSANDLDTDRQSDGVGRGLLGQPDGRAMRAGMSRRITGLARSPAVGGQGTR